MKNSEFDTSFRPRAYWDLRKMQKAQMIAIFDSLSPGSTGGISFNDPNLWLAEIHRLDQEEVNRSVLRLTRWITFMTLVITVATLVMVWAALD